MLLPDRIAAELRRELAAGQTCEYTLHALAKRFAVSVTPVREALAKLADSGHLVKLPNGRLQAAAHPPTAPKNDSTPPEDGAQDRLRAHVMGLSLTHEAPPFLREEEWAARLGIGRTVLRRLLFGMAGEGLLEHVPHRGWRAHPVSDADLEAFVAVRELLEPRALALAWDHLDRAFLLDVRAGNRPATGKTAPMVDNRLHAHWIGLCGNRYITDFFNRHGAVYGSLFDYAALDRGTASAMARQHGAILDAILAGDRAEACAQVAAHARAQLENARRLRRTLTQEK